MISEDWAQGENYPCVGVDAEATQAALDLVLDLAVPLMVRVRGHQLSTKTTRSQQVQGGESVALCLFEYEVKNNEHLKTSIFLIFHIQQNKGNLKLVCYKNSIW